MIVQGIICQWPEGFVTQATPASCKGVTLNQQQLEIEASSVK